MKWIPKPRDQARVYVGKQILRATVIGAYEEELFPGVFWLQLQDGSFIDAHRTQMRKIREKRTFFLARFEQGSPINIDGFAFPKMSLEAAKELASRHKIKEIIECKEIKKHEFIAPEMPQFLKVQPENG